MTTFMVGVLGAMIIWLLIQPVVFISHRLDEGGLPMGLVLGMRFVAAAYVGAGWAAWMVIRVLRVINQDGNTEPAVYYFLGIIFTVGAMASTFVGERQKIVSIAGMIFVGIAYLIFCMSPDLIMDTYGWFVYWYYGRLAGLV